MQIGFVEFDNTTDDQQQQKQLQDINPATQTIYMNIVILYSAIKMDRTDAHTIVFKKRTEFPQLKEPMERMWQIANGIIRYNPHKQIARIIEDNKVLFDSISVV